MDGAKTLSLSSAGAYGPSEAASELQSGVGTSTALDLSATSDELVFEKILTLIKGALVPSQYWLHVLMNKGHNLFLEHFGACIWNHVAIYETHSESDWLAVFLGAGGPRQFIHQAFPIANSRPTQLGDLLRKMVPPAPTQTYCDHYPVPACFPGYLTTCIRFGALRVTMCQGNFAETMIDICHDICWSNTGLRSGRWTSFHPHPVAPLQCGELGIC